MASEEEDTTTQPQYQQQDEDEDEEEEQPTLNTSASHRRRGGGRLFIDDEAEVSEEEAVQVSSDEDLDEEEEAKRVAEGFIVDEPEEEEEEDRRRHGDSDSEFGDLDAEDYAMIVEQFGITMRKGSDAGGNRKRKLLKNKNKNTSYFDDEEEEQVTRRGGRFYDDEEEEEDDRDQFIDDDEEEDELDEDDPDTQSRYRAKARRKQSYRRQAAAPRQPRLGVIAPEEAIEIFGDMTEFLQQESASIDDSVFDYEASKESKLDPVIADSLFIAPEDEKIRNTDLPERLQARIRFREKIDPESSISEEVDWIISQAFSDKLRDLPDVNRAAFVRSVNDVVRFIRQENLEVPFIHTYKKEYYQPYLNIRDIWTIDEYDEKWDHYHERRTRLTRTLQFFPGESTSLVNLASVEADIDDIEHYLQYKIIHLMGKKNSGLVDEILSGKRKLPTKRSFLHWNFARQLDDFVDTLLGDLKQYSENLLSGYLVTKLACPRYSVQAFAEEYISDRFTTSNSVIETGLKYAAWKFSMEPAVRCKMRQEFFNRALVSTKMTFKGSSEIEFGHEYFPIRSLFQKPVQYLEGEQFLLILKAEKDQMIELDISLDARDLNILLDKFSNYFECEPHDWSKEWTDARSQVVRISIDQYLLPLCQKYTRRRLEEKASAFVVGEAVTKFFKKVAVLPESFPNGLAAFATGDSQAPSYIVKLDKHGKVQAELALHFLKNAPKRQEFDRSAMVDSNTNDFRKLQSFLREHRPSLIVIDASSMVSRGLQDKIMQAYTGSGSCKIEFIDPEVARIYKTSDRARLEFRDANPLLPYAVSLGRLRLNPLAEIAGLCSKPRDMLDLSLHPLQKHVGTRDLTRGLHRVLIDLTSHVGVDVNQIVSHRHLSGPLQFAGGLGPRKAKHILQLIAKKGIITERQDLLSHDIVGPCVFRNFAGFTRIRPTAELDNIYISPLDDTRIHPDHYFLVDRVLSSMLEKPVEGDPKRSREIDRLRESNDFTGLEELDLDRYAEILEERKEGKFADILQDIKKELKSPWKDRLRLIHKSCSDEELFALFTGETVGGSLRIGQLVAVRVLHTSPNGVKVALDSDVVGFIPIEDLTDDRRSMDYVSGSELEFVSKYAEAGKSLKARITKILVDKFEVRLSAKPSDLNDKRKWENDYLGSEDVYIKQYAESKSQPSERVVPQVVKKPISTRPISHVSFANIDKEDAISRLRRAGNDEFFVFRPSSRGYDHLTITWKITDDLFTHIDVIESEKPGEMPQELGGVLTVNGKQFESIDDVIVNYLHPVIHYVDKMKRFRKFRAGKELDDMLRAEKEGARSTIAYLIGFDYNNPGYLVLCFLPDTIVFKESIKVTPDGYVFRKQQFESPEKLIEFFKRSSQPSQPPRSHHQHQNRSSGYPDQRDRMQYYSQYNSGMAYQHGNPPPPPNARMYRGSNY